MTRTLTLLLAVSCLIAPSAFADERDWSDFPHSHETAENFAVEFRVGSQQPESLGAAFSSFFGSDIGPLIEAEIDVLPFRIPYVGLIGLGAQFGWSQWDGLTLESGGTVQTDERTDLEILPLSGLAVLRVDVLARELDIPLIFTGKIGIDCIFWNSSPGFGSSTTTEGYSLGLHMAGQVALQLDFLSPRDALRLDAIWGINHSFVFGEIFYSMGLDDSQLPLDGLGFTAGLGLTL